MPRNKKYRKVCFMPESTVFNAMDNSLSGGTEVILSVEEYETIRLIDLEEMTQEQCAKHMKIARTTVQRIYNDARKKIAEFFVLGQRLKIQGGAYKICDGEGITADCAKGCRRRNGQDDKNKNCR